MTVRVPAGLKDQAKKVLADDDRELGAFVTACLTALTSEKGQERLLVELVDYWPAKKPRGRPPNAS